MKTFNKILAMLTALLMILCGLAACEEGGTGDTEPEAVSYTVNCVDENGAPVAGVLVAFAKADGQTQLAITGEDGILTVESEAAVTSVTVNSIPTGYSCETKTYNFEGAAEVTIVLTADVSADTTVTYTVTVVDDKGNPVSGVELQFCDENSCRQPVKTDENGTVSEKYVESEYHVTVNSVPDGYSVAETVVYFDADSTEMTIVLTVAE